MADEKHKSPRQIQRAITAYFNKCDKETSEVYDKKLQEVVTISTPTAYTLEGLCEVLEMEREEFINYEKQDDADQELVEIFRQARMRVQRDHVERALDGKTNVTLAIFVMKNNFGYKDRSEHDASVNLTNPLMVEVLDKETKRELKQLQKTLSDENNKRI